MRSKKSRIGSRLLLLLFLIAIPYVEAQTVCYGERPDIALPESRLDSLKALTKGCKSFIIATDMNRFGHYRQREVGYHMGEVASAVGAEFVVVTGDIFHYMGVQSVRDPIFRSCFEDMYTHPELQIPWYIIPGNHEYKGSTQALVDYSAISRRWCVPSLYYTKSIEEDSVRADLFFIDTPRLIDKYRNKPDEYPDASRHSREQELSWLKKSLSESQAKYKLVFGHHPIFAETSKNISEREDMQKFVDPLLRKYGVCYYFSGHLHNFQVIHHPGSEVHYLTISSISKTRVPKPITGTQYCSESAGFAVVCIGESGLSVFLLDGDARILYKEDYSAR